MFLALVTAYIFSIGRRCPHILGQAASRSNMSRIAQDLKRAVGQNVIMQDLNGTTSRELITGNISPEDSRNSALAKIQRTNFFRSLCRSNQLIGQIARVSALESVQRSQSCAIALIPDGLGIDDWLYRLPNASITVVTNDDEIRNDIIKQIPEPKRQDVHFINALSKPKYDIIFDYGIANFFTKEKPLEKYIGYYQALLPGGIFMTRVLRRPSDYLRFGLESDTNLDIIEKFCSDQNLLVQVLGWPPLRGQSAKLICERLKQCGFQDSAILENDSSKMSVIIAKSADCPSTKRALSHGDFRVE